MNYSTGVGIIIVVFGMFEIFVKPVILRRFMERLAPEHIVRVTWMTRVSGLIVVILGLMLLFGLWTRPA